jgi:hypothetical protein
MSKSSNAANAVVRAVEEVAALYRIPCFRMQSRVFTVTGKGGKPRPMFVGAWADAKGVKHTSGMADLLLLPRISFCGEECIWPLFCECKYGSSRLATEQRAFRDYVEHYGIWWLEVRDSADELLEWLKVRGVKRP